MTAKTNELSRHGIVQSGATEIPFTSRGHGQAVLLLCAGEPAPELVAALARRCRVIAPLFPPAASECEFARWLGVLIDGLGLLQPRAVFVGDAGIFADVARNDTERVARVDMIRSVVRRDDIAALVERLGLAAREP